MKTKYRVVEYKYNSDKDIWERTSYPGGVYHSLEEAKDAVRRARRMSENLSISKGYGEEPYTHHILREQVKEPVDKIMEHIGYKAGQTYTREELRNILEYVIDLGVVTVDG